MWNNIDHVFAIAEYEGLELPISYCFFFFNHFGGISFLFINFNKASFASSGGTKLFSFFEGNGGTHGDEPELYSDPRCNTSLVDSTASSQLEASGQGSECKSTLLVEEVEKKGGQDLRPTNISTYEIVEGWLQSICSANGLPFLSPGGPESLDTVHNDTLTLLTSVESARAMIEGRE